MDIGVQPEQVLGEGGRNKLFWLPRVSAMPATKE